MFSLARYSLLQVKSSCSLTLSRYMLLRLRRPFSMFLKGFYLPKRGNFPPTEMFNLKTAATLPKAVIWYRLVSQNMAVSRHFLKHFRSILLHHRFRNNCASLMIFQSCMLQINVFVNKKKQCNNYKEYKFIIFTNIFKLKNAALKLSLIIWNCTKYFIIFTYFSKLLNNIFYFLITFNKRK